MTKTPFDHFVITRFNVRQTPNDTTLVTDLDWLNDRMDLLLKQVRAVWRSFFG